MKIDKLKEIVKEKRRAPFLFLGSGFTRHYLDTPNWESLLSRFAKKHINWYYTSLGTKDLSIVASEIAKECNEEFWSLPSNNAYKENFQDKAVNPSSVLKDTISSYLKEFSKKEPDQRYKEELDLLAKISIEGIITTNWDDFCERIFPKFKTVVGQKELLLSESIVSVGEIYKIHGCINEPESLILTQEDYKEFDRKNTYLAAKLITIFIEHPIVFIGYSMNDKNIKTILASIVKCLDQDGINRLQKNLFFVEWDKDKNVEMDIERHDIQMSEGVTLPVIRINTHEFKSVYECFSVFERKIPATTLRLYKQYFYDIIRSEKPEKKLYVLPDEELEKSKDIQFVCGFGVISKFQSAVGYTGLKSTDIFKDVVFENGNYDSRVLLTVTIPDLRKHTPYIPVYKYLRSVGINSDEDFNNGQFATNLKKLPQCGDFCKGKFNEDEKRFDLKKAIEQYSGSSV